MAIFEIYCDCGKALEIDSAQAGTSLSCGCGRTIAVPKLSDLQRHYRAQVSSDRKEYRQSKVGPGLLVGIILLAAIWMWNPSSLPMIAFLVLFVGGKLWFLGLMFSELGIFALLIFIIPLFDWLFLFIRFDVAWKPVCCQILGVLALLIGSRI